jgi:putative hemolysin
MNDHHGLIDILVLLVLFLCNGFFSLSEMALVSSRKARLKTKADEGKKGYKRALMVSEKPAAFLSTIQIGITLIGTISGAFGGATLAGTIAAWVANIKPLAAYAQTIGLVLVVIVITFLSIIIGELVPKQIALSSPEKIASKVVGPINVVAFFFRPIEKFLSASAALALRLLRVKTDTDPEITEEEVRVMIQEGTRSGVFEKNEGDMVEGVFYLGDRSVGNFATHRSEIVWMDIDDDMEAVRQTLLAHVNFNAFPVCQGSEDRPLGIVKTRALLSAFLENGFTKLEDYLETDVFIPESMSAIKTFEVFRRSGAKSLLVLDEYGSMQGLINLRDLIEEIVGELSQTRAQEKTEIVKRADGSYLVDGSASLDTLRERFGNRLPFPDSRDYHTLAGFMLDMMGSIPKTGDSFLWQDVSFEVIDMDLNRIDKILVTFPSGSAFPKGGAFPPESADTPD